MLNKDSMDMDNVSQEDADAFEKKALGVLKDEIQNDPVKRGYAGKSSQEIADLLNSEYETTTEETTTVPLAEAIQNELSQVNINNVAYIIDAVGTVTCDPVFKPVIQSIVDTAKTKLKKTVTTIVTNEARILDILVGVPYTNNQVTAEDVTSATK